MAYLNSISMSHNAPRAAVSGEDTSFKHSRPLTTQVAESVKAQSPRPTTPTARGGRHAALGTSERRRRLRLGSTESARRYNSATLSWQSVFVLDEPLVNVPTMAYKKAPITEAVIELRFARSFDKALIEDAARRLRGEYFYQDPENAVNVKIEVGTQKTQVDTAWQGVKLSSLDRTDCVFFRTNTFICSRLAPYTGWEDFSARALRGWEVWRKTAGSIELARIGVRYINRLDIPSETDASLNVEDYLNVSPHSPGELARPMSSFTMQIVKPLDDDCMLALNSGTVVPPLIGFASLALDLDVFREVDLPRRDEDLWALINRIRDHKNRVFESCITDRARALFN